MKEPIGAECEIRYLDDESAISGAYFSFGGIDGSLDEFDSFGIPDHKIFYFVSDEYVLKQFMTEGVEDFVVLSYELIYQQEDESESNE